MIGTKFMKPISDWNEYAKTAEWCNTNGAFIKEYEDRYEVETIPAPTFEELKERKLNELESSFQTRTSGSITTSQGYNMQFSPDDSLKMQGAITLLEVSGAETGYLTQADDTTVYDVPVATIKAVMVEMLQAYAKCHAQKQVYRQQINACTTQAELSHIEIEWEV